MQTDDPRDHARQLLQTAVAGLPEVTWRKMFGCATCFAPGGIFGLIWDGGRIGLRLPDPEWYDELLAEPGAEPWRIDPGRNPMGHWILVPPAWHDRPAVLADWATRAYRLAAVPTRKPRPKRSRHDR